MRKPTPRAYFPVQTRMGWAVLDCLYFLCVLPMRSILNFMTLELRTCALRFSCHSALGLRCPLPEHGFPSSQDQPRMGCIALLSLSPQASHVEHTHLLMAKEHGVFALRISATQPLAQEAHSPNKFPRPIKNGLHRAAYNPSACFSECS